MRSSSWLIACSAASARSSDVIAIVSLRKSNVAPMIGCRPVTVKLRTRARTAQAHRLSGHYPATIGAGAECPRDCVRGAARGELARFPTVLLALLIDLEPSAWRARPAPAEWAPVEIVCHLRDEEVEDFGARLRVVVEGGTAFAPIDPERWAVERRYLDADGPAT